MKPAKTFRERYGTWAVVAGASEGLGAALASSVAERGVNVALVARRQAVLDETAERIRKEYNVDVRTLSIDLCERDAALELDERTRDIEVGLFVYNAAYSLIGDFLDRPIAEHLKEIEINCAMPMALSHVFGRRMIELGRGGIVLMSSLAAFQGSPLVANYGATKAYNLVLAEGLSDEFRPHGVDVLVSCAGATRTPNFEATNPAMKGSALVPVLEPRQVAEETLNALGRGPLVIPGRANRAASFLLRRLMSRRRAVAIMGSNTRRMYS